MDPLDGADDAPIEEEEDDLLDGVTKGGGGLGCATGETDGGQTGGLLGLMLGAAALLRRRAR